MHASEGDLAVFHVLRRALRTSNLYPQTPKKLGRYGQILGEKYPCDHPKQTT